MHAYLAVICHLHFGQNDRGLLRATAVTRGWNGYRNKSQHRKLTLENKILPPLLRGFELATFRSQSVAPTTELSPLSVVGLSHTGSRLRVTDRGHTGGHTGGRQRPVRSRKMVICCFTMQVLHRWLCWMSIRSCSAVCSDLWLLSLKESSIGSFELASGEYLHTIFAGSRTTACECLIY